MSPEKIVAIVMLISIMFNAGLQIDRERLFAALKDYSLLARALLANFIIVPLLGVLLVRVFNLSAGVAVGFLLMAIAPGVPFLVRAAGRQPGGSLAFAAELAFIMPALSILTIPITTRFIFPPEIAAQVPFGSLLITLVGFQLVPLLIGLLVAYRAPAVATKLQRPLTLVFFVAVIALLVILGPTIIKGIMSIYGSHGIWAMLVLVLLSLGIGYLLGGPHIEYRRTLSIATALRNIGTCAVIATSSFGHTLVAATVLTYFIVQFIIALIARVYFHRTETTTASPT
jgi:predicted Na+-dependent transporter